MAKDVVSRLADSLWRAAAYCLHPVVIVLSFMPVLIMGAAAWFLARFYWEDALDAVMGWEIIKQINNLLAGIGLAKLHTLVGQLVVVMLATPVIVVGSLLLVTAMMAPWMVKLVARRRFPALEKLRGGTIVGSVFHALWVTAVAAVVLVVSMPLWLIPPLILILPPVIWGWLTYRVMSYDVLADHATRQERREIVRAHRWTLLGMGVLSGYVSMLPSMVWGIGAALIYAPFVIMAAIWIYTLVFAFTGLWFGHYLLSALADLREFHAREAKTRQEALPPAIDVPIEVLPLP
ncbi:EI24 domain-containing protein [Piscinibacter terrae]|uniref:Etoposide-induced protein 2.4 (EI24) n=1 Tax=Piscinibacter terrae TaxID=2496871 RepID=A0A3N7JYM5_9BURK|nr:EI24 domain-containing protein [Albitalea terrae]RQP25909.1 hypothetical protein DZC73_02320 [Albitalea terrae]